jgi:ribosomal protein S18 acetylase RimI-like enzyme
MRLVRDAFRDHWGVSEHSEEVSMEAWRKIRLEAPDFDPTLYFLAMDGDQIAGASLCRPSLPEDERMGYVWTLAVGRPWRKRGLGEALLRHSFQEFYRRGKLRAALHVDADSLTGAVRLYEKVGMRSDPQRLMTRFEKVLRPGRDLREHGMDA